MDQKPTPERFVAQYFQLDDEQKAALRALILAQARIRGALQGELLQRLRFQPRGPSLAAQVLQRHAVQGGEDSGATPAWKSEAKELMGQFQKQSAARRAEGAAAAATRRQEIAEARAVWRAENAARAQSVRRGRDESPPTEGSARGMPSAAAEILDHHGAESGGDSSATPPWKSEARELMAQIRKGSADRSAEVARDRAARRTEVQEFMRAQRQQIAQARKGWREEGAARSKEARSFMARLRAERRGEWSGVEIVASAVPSSPADIRQRE